MTLKVGQRVHASLGERRERGAGGLPSPQDGKIAEVKREKEENAYLVSVH